MKGSNGIRGSDAGNRMFGGGKGLNRPTNGQEVGYADADGMKTVEDWACHPECPVRLLDEQYGDKGGPSRFFYCAKASRAERGEGNNHSTVKPLALLRWLCTLTATPEGGTVLDPFMGSGTTGVACLQTGRRFIGVEIDPTYHAITAKRLREAPPSPAGQNPGVT